MLTDPRFLIKYTSRSRPENFFRGLDNITKLIQTRNYQILCTLDVDDKTMANNEVRDRISGYDNVREYYGFSENKVDAINRDLWFADPFDILINFSDDIVFTTKSFDEFIKEDANKYFPNGDFFLHYPDNNGGDRIPIMSVMDKKYFDRFGYIYHRDYSDFFCDNEAMEVAKKLGRYKFVKRKIFSHLHPHHKLAEWDEQYLKAKNNYQKDSDTFHKRLSNNFDL